LCNDPVALGGAMADLNEQDIRFIEQKLPKPYNNADRFHEAINQRLTEHKDLCTLVIKEVEKLLQLLQDSAPKQRLSCRIDSSNQTKSPERIIQKIRTQKDGKGRPLHTWDNFSTTMTDLARFRIIANFLGDVDRIVEGIETHKPFLSYFTMKKDNTIDDPLKGRHSGERSVKLVLIENQSNMSVEIQVMTMFQEAWDKKDHCLVYEKVRIDEEVPPELKALSLITSELLYTADKYYEDFRKDEERP